jgi:hypothetical protein
MNEESTRSSGDHLCATEFGHFATL